MALLCALPAAAGTRSSAKTIVHVYGIGSGGGDTVLALGSLDSPSPKCVANRKIKIDLIRMGKGPFHFDLARTSKRGGWAASVDGNDIPPATYTALRATAAEKTVSLGNGKELVCKADKAEVPLN